MAAILPAINQGGDLVSQRSPTIRQMHVPGPPSKNAGSSLSKGSMQVGIAKLRKSQGKKDRELEQRRQALRAEQVELGKQQTSQYRNTYKHNLCLDMLQEGFHKSFAELFALIQQQNDEREQAGPESVLWNQTLLQEQPEKLDVLQQLLTTAEAAFRKDNFVEVYHCQHQLAYYFQQTGDKWLADHFFNSCLMTSTSVKGDEGRTAAEGHCNVGLALERSGQSFEAAENFELFQALSKEKADWASEDGEPMHYKACTHLCRIYTTIAHQFEAEDDLQSYLQYLQKAYEMSKGAGDKKLEGEASYRLGVAFEKNGDAATALTNLNKYLDICRSVDDNEGFGKACQAIAKSYESQSQVEESIKYLQLFVEVAEKSKDDKAISRACSDLGAVFNSLGRYDQAVEYFNKSYNISRTMNDTETISSSRVLFGVAAAHKMLQHFSLHVEVGTRPCLERQTEWKDNRGDEFDKPIPEPEPEPVEEKKPEEAKKEAPPRDEKPQAEAKDSEEKSEEKPEAEPEKDDEDTADEK